MNELYPIFLKVAELKLLIVGGGNVGLEKLTFLLKSSPSAKVQMVAIDYLDETRALAKKHNVELIQEPYSSSYLEGKHVVIAATDDQAVNLQIKSDCKARHLLVNVADQPEHCDFYMGGIVTKGNLKLGISTNGTSPTAAKRLRQFFEEFFPENMDDLLNNLNAYRKTLKRALLK